MAYQKQNPTNSSNKNADAFINVVVTDKAGNEHRLRRGIPLDASNQLERSIINKAVADDGYTITLTGSVHVVPDPETETSDIDL